MAIALDTTTSGSTTTTSTTYTQSHTCSGSDRLLVVLLAHEGTTSNLPAGVTYAGQAMTKAVENTQNPVKSQIWYIANPTSGANNISISTPSASFQWRVLGISFTGARQTSPLDTTTSSISAAATSASNNVTPSDNKCMVIDLYVHDGSGTPTIGADQTSLYAIDDSTMQVGASYVIQTTRGQETMSWSSSVSDETVHLVAVFKAVAENVSVSVDQGALALSGSTDFSLTMPVDAASLSLSGSVTTEEKNGWSNQSKSSTSWTNQDKS